MIDKTKITIPPTTLPEALFKDPDNFFKGEYLEGGQVVPMKKYRQDAHGDKVKIHIGVGDAITVFAERSRDGSLLATKIELNLIKLLYGHNGVVLAEKEFLQSLSLLVEHLAALFGSRELALALVPGLVETSQSHWSFLEIPAHREDPNLQLFNTLKNAAHPCSPKRLVSAKESVRFGGKRSALAVSVYRKRLEMLAKYGDDKVENNLEVLRVEVVLKESAISREFGNLGPVSGVQWMITEREYGHTLRLVSFEYHDLISVHQAVMKRFKGVPSFSSSAKTVSKPDQTGAFIAHAFRNFAPPNEQDVHQWIDLYGSVTGAATDRIARVRRSCLQVMEKSGGSSLSVANLFDDKSYQSQPAVSVPVKERVTQQTRLFSSILPEVQKAYGSSNVEGGFPWLASCN